MDKIKKAVKASKDFVVAHKLGLAVAATAFAAVAISRTTAREFNDFLETKGLTEEFAGRFNQYQ